MRHLADPVGAGAIDAPDAIGEAGSQSCGDLVRIAIRVVSGRVREAGFLAFGCGAATAAASAACELLRGARLDDAARIGADELDRRLGGLGAARRHGPEIVADAVAAALERWYSDHLGGPGIPRSARRVAVGMSGGVDSAAAAMLLRDAGYEPIGVTMRLWHDPGAAAAERSCCAPETVRLARASAHALGIPHITLDVAERFRSRVVADFVDGYAAGRTPNPCVTCNGVVRFAILDEVARLVGAYGLATGHYARIERRSGGRAGIAAARDLDKDQSYMLSMLSGPLLDRLIFPLGDLTKAETRELAHGAGLPAADAVESQEICFVGEGGYRDFLARNAGLAALPGPILDPDGRRLGTHQGYWRYTVGQRKGLGIASERPLYVLRTDPARNAVWVGPRELLAVDRLRLEPAIVHDSLEPGPLEIRVRYRGRPLRGVVAESGADAVDVALAEPAHGVAPGQTAALYRDGRLVAAGTITVAPGTELED
jgi:tRNA-specific 2-thiouridylase